MKSIAFVIERMNNFRGTERALSSVANALVDLYDISIITSSQGHAKDAFPLDERIHRFDIGINQNLKYNTIFYNRILHDYKKKLTKFLNYYQFDIVVALSGLQYYFLHQIKDGSKKIAWFHFDFNISNHLLSNRKLPIKRVLVRLHTMRRVSHARMYSNIIVVSRYQEKLWRKYCSNVICIYNPISIQTSEVAKLNNRQAIAVGSLTHEKGFDVLIKAWAIVSDKFPDWRLNIFGEGGLKTELQELINNLNLQNSVVLRGMSDNISSEYLEHSMCILSSNTEALPLVLVEAQMCGLPIVSTFFNETITEIISEGKNGEIVNPPNDIEQFANKICMLIESRAIRSEYGQLGRQMQYKFQTETVIKQWKQLIDGI